jgi:Bacterial Ig-like domain
MIFNLMSMCRWSIAACLLALMVGCGGGGGANDPILGVPVSIAAQAPNAAPVTPPPVEPTPTIPAPTTSTVPTTSTTPTTTTIPTTSTTPTTPTGTVTVSPTVLEVSPADGEQLVCPEDNLRAKFSEPMDPATITVDTFLLTFIDSNGVEKLVEVAAIDYDAATRTAILVPSGLLVGDAIHTATIKSGVDGVKNLAGVPLASDFVWSFRTRRLICT